MLMHFLKHSHWSLWSGMKKKSLSLNPAADLCSHQRPCPSMHRIDSTNVLKMHAWTQTNASLLFFSLLPVKFAQWQISSEQGGGLTVKLCRDSAINNHVWSLSSHCLSATIQTACRCVRDWRSVFQPITFKLNTLHFTADRFLKHIASFLIDFLLSAQALVSVHLSML